MIHTKPPARRQCEAYGNGVRCINAGTHWVKWPVMITDPTNPRDLKSGESDFSSWECDNDDHRFGEAA